MGADGEPSGRFERLSDSLYDAGGMQGRRDHVETAALDNLQPEAIVGFRRDKDQAGSGRLGSHGGQRIAPTGGFYVARADDQVCRVMTEDFERGVAVRGHAERPTFAGSYCRKADAVLGARQHGEHPNSVAGVGADDFAQPVHRRLPV